MEECCGCWNECMRERRVVVHRALGNREVFETTDALSASVPTG